MTQQGTRSGFAPKSFSSGEGGASSSSSSPAPGETFKTFFNAAPEAPTPLPFKPRPDLCLNFRHSGWMDTRKRVEETLDGLANVSPRRVAAFRACGADAYVECACLTSNPFNNPNFKHRYKYRVRSTKCHDRFCLPCSQERGLRVGQQLAIHTAKMPALKLLTLTLKEDGRPLQERMDRLTACFRKLRASAQWKKIVKGGAAIIEYKIGKNLHGWHVHYHILMESGYFPHADLKALWKGITGDSDIVDIRPVGSRRGGISYVTKYVTKVADRTVTSDPAVLAEAIEALTGRRLVSTFGTWRGLKLMERPADEENTEIPEGDWRTVGSLDAIIDRAMHGDFEALQIVRHVAPAKFRDSS